MIPANSRTVESRQSGIHPRLDETVLKHREHPWQKPLADHSLEAFRVLAERVERWTGPLVLDTGCGTGSSTVALSRRFPDALVLGVDKSWNRLSKRPPDTDRCLWERIDLEDFWRLAAEAQWTFSFQALYYPNPWPKPEHRLRRWPFHPVLPTAIRTGGTWELRTNWQIYALEMARAFELLTGVRSEVEPWSPVEPETLFEKKYGESGHRLWRWSATATSTPSPG